MTQSIKHTHSQKMFTMFSKCMVSVDVYNVEPRRDARSTVCSSEDRSSVNTEVRYREFIQSRPSLRVSPLMRKAMSKPIDPVGPPVGIARSVSL